MKMSNSTSSVCIQTARAVEPKSTRKIIYIDGFNLKIEQVYDIAKNHVEVQLKETAISNIEKCRQNVKDILNKSLPTYGVNTGFGIFADEILDESHLSQLNRNLITSHAIAVGIPLPEEIVRAGMLIRANTLSRGNSGVRVVVIQTLLDMLNKNVTPVVNCQGSLAASGDLCLLSQVALVATTAPDEKEIDAKSSVTQNSKETKTDNYDGEAYFEGKRMKGSEAMAAARIKKIVLEPKEGLAFNNGSTFTAGLACLNIVESEKLFKIATVSLALTMEALCALSVSSDPRIHKARNQDGQIEVAKQIRKLINGSKLIDSMKRVQDPYTIRCSYQVHGAILDSLKHCRNIISKEINASTDNPLIFDSTRSLSGGNFHGEPLAIVMDLLKISMSELGAISERRSARLVDDKLNNGLPCMLVDPSAHKGLNSGLMIAQYTAAALALENQHLAGPDSIYSLSTSANQEDHISNGMTAARHGYQIVDNIRSILSLELFEATRALHIRLHMKSTQNMDEAKMSGDDNKLFLGEGTLPLYQKLMKIADYVPKDYYFKPAVDALKEYIMTDDFQETIDRVIGSTHTIDLDIPIGTRDFHPAQMKLREDIITKIANVYKKHGCVTIDTPVFEKREILMGKYGDNDKLVYDLEDQGGQLLTLRYDLTVPFARYMAMHNLTNIKRYQVAKVYRRDNPSISQGRYREFVQMDIDFAGKEDSTLQDAEMIKILDESLTAVNVGPYMIKLNHRELLTTILGACGVEEKNINSVCSTIDKLDKNTWEEVSEELLSKGLSRDIITMIGNYTNISGEPMIVLNKLSQMIKLSSFSSVNEKLTTIVNELKTLFIYLDAMKCINRVEFSLNLARGLDYYTGIIIEAIITDKSLGIGSIAGGGRYDNLIGMFHPQKRQIPSVGFSIGIERIFTILESKIARSSKIDTRSTDTQVLICPIQNTDGKLTPIVMSIAAELWEHGIRTEIPHTVNPKMKDMIERSIGSGIPIMILVGSSEVSNNTVTIKNVSTKNQCTVGRSEYIQFIKKLLA